MWERRFEDTRANVGRKSEREAERRNGGRGNGGRRRV
jgi:hypothetical protein